MRGSILDLVLIVAVLIFAWTGYRQGFVVGLFSFLGFFGGALLGVQLAPLVAQFIDDDRGRVFVALAIAFTGAILGQTLTVMIGHRLRKRLRDKSLRTVDSIGGAVVSGIAVLLVAWMIAVPLASSPSPWLSSQVRRSTVLAAVNEVVPNPVRSLYGSFSDAVRRNDFPDVFGELTPTQVAPVGPPNAALASDPDVQRIRPSVVKILGEARSCNRRLEGSGFVYASQRVMTNAHVVAGVRSPRVEAGNRAYNARVVVYDPYRDLAVLYVPELTAPPLPFTTEAKAGADAIALGYPLNGPYTATPAKVRDVRSIQGPNIYQSETVVREVYSLRATVRSGNSGGPLVSPAGAVYGVIFAAAADDPQTGFALTNDEVRSVAMQGQRTTTSVSTQSCA